jgi:exonuclease VII small subunit
MEQRLRNNLGPRVLEQTRAQTTQLLETAKAAIAQKTSETHDEFLKRVTRELQMVEERARGLSADIAENQREHLNRGMGEFHQHVVDAGTRLKRLSEDLFRVMQHDLGEEHDVRRQEFEQVQASMSADKARLDKEVAQLDSRIAKLDESAHSLETGLDKRLGQMASNTLGDVRKQMESAVDEIMIELETRSSRELGAQVEAACAQLKIIQTEVQTSTVQSLNARVVETLRVFAQSMQELERESVERLRTTLAGGLNSVIRNLGEQLRTEGEGTERRWPAAD